MNHLIFTKNFWKAHLKPRDLAVDATCGNGHDTLFLSKLCTVIGLDIQADAIQKTETLLKEHGNKAILHRMNHSDIDSLPLPHEPRLIVYNLGYLPGGDKSITTLKETTLESVKKCLEILASDGAPCITCYPGHQEGNLEEQVLCEWAKSLPKNRWIVSYHKWLNRNKAPSVFWIQGFINSDKI